MAEPLDNVSPVRLGLPIDIKAQISRNGYGAVSCKSKILVDVAFDAVGHHHLRADVVRPAWHCHAIILSKLVEDH